MIQKSDCKHRFLYRIHSRNLRLGVFNEFTGGFIGLRTKFRSVFAFEEYHWDNGPPYGTVKPQELLEEELPADIDVATSLGTICGNCNELCSYTNGEWHHDHPSDCPDVKPYDKHNAALEQWLHRMEDKYKT